MKPRVAIIDDDRLFARALGDTLAADATSVERFHDLASARAALETRGFDVAILDQHLDDGHGLELLAALTGAQTDVKVIVVSAHADTRDAVAAKAAGIFGYVTKPAGVEQLRLCVLQAAAAVGLARQAALSDVRTNEDRRSAHQFVGSLPPTLRDLATRAARSRAPLLLRGETGTGKTALARAIHFFPGGPAGAFVALNCAAIPEALLEAELFGSERGAFTGAVSRPGAFEQAEGGTLFLDEIGELPHVLQAKLLTAVEGGTIRRLGDRNERRVDVRIAAATHVDLSDRSRTNFREDLAFRLRVLEIVVPPLRERETELVGLIEQLRSKLEPSGRRSLAEGEIERLRRYRWPGNVRELRNVLERALILEEGPFLHPSRLLGEANQGEPHTSADDVLLTLEEVERRHVARVLQHHGGNRERAASHLGIGVATLRRKLRSI
jgi:DNA-binding NtrC family response regulator